MTPAPAEHQTAHGPVIQTTHADSLKTHNTEVPMARSGVTRAGTTRLGSTAGGAVFDVVATLEAALDTPARRQDLDIIARDYVAVRFDVNLSPAGAPDDLNNVDAEWSAAVTRGGDAILDETQSGVSLSVDSAGGTALLTIATGETADLGGGRYHHELDLVDIQGRRRTAATGTLHIEHSTT